MMRKRKKPTAREEVYASQLLREAETHPLNFDKHIRALNQITLQIPIDDALRSYMRVETRMEILDTLKQKFGIDPNISLMIKDLKTLIHNIMYRKKATLLSNNEWSKTVQELKWELTFNAMNEALFTIQKRVYDVNLEDPIIVHAMDKLSTLISNPDDLVESWKSSN